MGTGTSLTSAAKARAKLPAASASQASDLDESKWIDESFALAKQWVYVSPIGKKGKGPYSTTNKYKADAKSVASQRIALAGARLANVIYEALK